MSAILEFFSSLPRELYVFVISMLPIVELRGAIPIGASLDIPFYLNYLLAIVGNLLPVPFILWFISRFMDFLAKFKIFRPMINWIRRKADKHSSKVIKDESAKPVSESVSERSTESQETASAECTCEIDAEIAKASSVECTCDASAESTKTAECTCEADTVEQNAALADNTCEASTDTAPAPRKMTRAIFIALMLFVAIPIPGTGAWTGSLIAALFNLPKKRSLLAVTVGVLLSGVIMSLASYGVVGFLSFIA